MRFVVCFFFASQIYNILVLPYRWARAAARQIEMIYTAPQEFFFTQLKLALFGAVFLAFPMIASADLQVRGAGPLQERAQGVPALPDRHADAVPARRAASSISSSCRWRCSSSCRCSRRAARCEIQLQARVSEYLSLIMTLILGFGICFQLPVVLTLLARAGIITRATSCEKRAPLCDRRHHRGGGRAVAARPVQHARHGAADDAALRAVDLGGGARRSPATAAASSARLPRRAT